MLNFINKDSKSLRYFETEMARSEHQHHQAKVKLVDNHFLRQHKVLERQSHKYTFKNKEFTPNAIILQGLKTVCNFHTAYLVGNPVSITGTPEAVELMNKHYRKGLYPKTDWEILREIIKHGNAFEYVYLEDGVIKSKVFKNKYAYPIYDNNRNYVNFVEHWKDADGHEHNVIYHPNKVETYVDRKLVRENLNLTGLPIHYASLDESKYEEFGEGMIVDLIEIQDQIEFLLSKLDDAVTTLSLNPIGVMKGTTLSDNDMIDSNISGAVLNVDTEGDFDYANAEMDYNCIKFELDNLYQQFNMVACVPSGVLGNGNVANVSENTTNIIYNLTENKGKEHANILIEGFAQRWQKMRFLMNTQLDEAMTDEDFDSLNVSFNYNKPIDNKNNMENMKMQFDMGAISRRTVMEKSPYTTDSAQELERLDNEGKNIEDKVG